VFVGVPSLPGKIIDRELSNTRRKILRRFAAWILLPLLFLIVGALLYIKMYGFQKALEDLTYSRTNGAYSLVIKKSSVDVFDLNFTFEDVEIKKNPSRSDTLSHTVTIPRLRINFGSVVSMFALEKFKIDNLEIEEPLIKVKSRVRDRRRTNSMLPQQIIKLYPVIESLLSRFEIKSLSIKRATLSLVKPNNAVTIRFIDLLVEHWNILHIDKNSQLLLHVNRQLVDLGKVSLDFSQVEYDFKKRHLQFSLFTLATTDTVSASRVEVVAKSLLLNHLDYKELYENQRYVLRRAVLDSPVIHARFALRAGKKSKWDKEKGILTRILKQTFGECMIDSTIVRNARLDLVLRKSNDSVMVDLHHVDFRLHAFRVRADEETFRVGEMETNLNGTTISLKNDLSLRFNQIFFRSDRDVTITNAALLNGDRKPVATIGTMRIDDADILPFVFTKHFHAQRLQIENAVINIPERNNKNKPRKESADVKEIRIDNTSLRNITFHYQDSRRHFSVEGFAATAKNVRYDSNGVVSYAMDHINVYRAFADLSTQRLNARVNNVVVQNRVLKFESAVIRKDSLDVTLRNLTGEAVNNITTENYQAWKTLSIEDAVVHGILPSKTTTPPQNVPLDVLVHALRITHLDAAISSPMVFASGQGEDIRIGELRIGQHNVNASDVSGEFRNVNLKRSNLHILASKVNVDYPRVLKLENVNIVKDSTHVSMRSLISQGMKNENDFWRSKAILASKIGVKHDHETLFESDSIRFGDVSIHRAHAPEIGVVEIFHPIVQSSPKKHRGQTPTTDQLGLVVPGKWIIHPGEWRSAHRHPVFFGRWDIDEEKKSVHCTYIHTASEKMNIRLQNIALTDHEATVDSVILREKQDWIRNHPVEDDRINTSLYGIKIKGVSRDALMNRKPLRHMDVTVRNVDLDVRRDKRLPDPPATKKPIILEGIIRLPSRMRVIACHVVDGHIRYTETSDKTGEDGFVDLTKVAAEIRIDTATSFLSMHASASPYGSGNVNIIYQTIDSTSFKLFVKASDIDLTKFNNVVVPFLPARITSGHLKEYDLDVTANADEAVGKATITYSKLHFQLVNKETPDKKKFKTELLTFIADDLVLRNKRNRAIHEVYQVRLKNKSVFNYWVKSIVSGAVGAVRKGKREKPHID